MKYYTIISIKEIEGSEDFKKAILVKVNPVETLSIGNRGMNHCVSHEYDGTLSLVFYNNPITNNLAQLIDYAKMCETNRYLGIDLDNWFIKRETNLDNQGEFSVCTMYFVRKHDEYFDEMEFYYQTHFNENYHEFDQERYVARQRMLRDSGRCYDDSIDLQDEDENIW